MLCLCVLIIAAAAVYMVEAYIHTYYAIEYMHGAPLFFVLLAKYAAPVLFLLLCGYFVFRYREKRRESEKPAQDKPMNREEVYAEKIVQRPAQQDFRRQDHERLSALRSVRYGS